MTLSQKFFVLILYTCISQSKLMTSYMKFFVSFISLCISVMKPFKVGCALKTSQMVLICVTSLIGTSFKFTDFIAFGRSCRWSFNFSMSISFLYVSITSSGKCNGSPLALLIKRPSILLTNKNFFVWIFFPDLLLLCQLTQKLFSIKIFYGLESMLSYTIIVPVKQMSLSG